jgi:NAD(P)-dependent dehydrogenase (short-subunit alcohol dehydrogenase family)
MEHPGAFFPMETSSPMFRPPMQGTTDMTKVWLITGSSRGLGRNLAEAALEQGHSVVATARDPKSLASLAEHYGDRILPIALDVTDETQAAAAIEAAFARFGRLDVLANNAGYGFIGAFEEMTPAQFRGQIDTNFWGTVNVTRAALPHLRRQGFGHIFQFSSVGGRHAMPGLSGYHAAKFAVEGFSESLAQEIKPLGLKLTIVEPGGFRTDWAGSSMAYAEPMPEYAPSVGAFSDFIKAHGPEVPGDPRKAARVILDIAEMRAPPLRLPLGNDALAIMRNGLKASLAELERNATVTGSTDFDGLTVSDQDHAVLSLTA